MTMSEIKDKAKKFGINTDNMTKAELICAMQKAEGFTPCFGSGNKDCPYTDCCFRTDCLNGIFSD